MKRVRFLFMDVDGTLTDGKIYFGNRGEMLKRFDVKDGYAIAHILPQYNIEPIIITGRKSKIVDKRCRELGVSHIYQNVKDKRSCMINVCNMFGLNNQFGIYQEIAYIGDDIPDIECMEIAGMKGCPIDALEIVKTKVDFVSSKRGGDGAVREFIDWLVAYTGNQ